MYYTKRIWPQDHPNSEDGLCDKEVPQEEALAAPGSRGTQGKPALPEIARSGKTGTGGNSKSLERKGA